MRLRFAGVLLNYCALNTLAIVLLGAIASPVSAQNSTVGIRAGRLGDSKSGRILRNQVVLVEGEKISAVGSSDQVHISAGAQVIDLGKATVLPGLIDGHTHVFGFGLDGLKPGPAARERR